MPINYAVAPGIYPPETLTASFGICLCMANYIGNQIGKKRCFIIKKSLVSIGRAPRAPRAPNTSA